MSNIENLKSFGTCALPQWNSFFFQPAFHSATNTLVSSEVDKSLIFSTDPFADTGDDETELTNYIHIRIQQRNGRKTLTTVQGLPDEYDSKKILKVIKKEFACNGNIVKDDELGEVIQLQGDQRLKVMEFMVQTLGLKKKNIKIHGF